MERRFADVLDSAPPMKRPAAATSATATATAKAKAAVKTTPMKKVKASGGSKCTPAKGVAKAAASVPKKAAKAAAPAPKMAPVRASSLKFPGVPTVAQAPVEFGKWKIYVSLPRGVWRTLKQGQRVDQQFSFTSEPEKAWKRL
eukprot:1503036-Pyramimonas_sp.AAC.1